MANLVDKFKQYKDGVLNPQFGTLRFEYIKLFNSTFQHYNYYMANGSLGTAANTIPFLSFLKVLTNNFYEFPFLPIGEVNEDILRGIKSKYHSINKFEEFNIKDEQIYSYIDKVVKNNNPEINNTSYTLNQKSTRVYIKSNDFSQKAADNILTGKKLKYINVIEINGKPANIFEGAEIVYVISQNITETVTIKETTNKYDNNGNLISSSTNTKTQQEQIPITLNIKIKYDYAPEFILRHSSEDSYNINFDIIADIEITNQDINGNGHNQYNGKDYTQFTNQGNFLLEKNVSSPSSDTEIITEKTTDFNQYKQIILSIASSLPNGLIKIQLNDYLDDIKLDVKYTSRGIESYDDNRGVWKYSKRELKFFTDSPVDIKGYNFDLSLITYAVVIWGYRKFTGPAAGNYGLLSSDSIINIDLHFKSWCLEYKTSVTPLTGIERIKSGELVVIKDKKMSKFIGTVQGVYTNDYRIDEINNLNSNKYCNECSCNYSDDELNYIKKDQMWYLPVVELNNEMKIFNRNLSETIQAKDRMVYKITNINLNDSNTYKYYFSSYIQTDIVDALKLSGLSDVSLIGPGIALGQIYNIIVAGIPRNVKFFNFIKPIELSPYKYTFVPVTYLYGGHIYNEIWDSIVNTSVHASFGNLNDFIEMDLDIKNTLINAFALSENFDDVAIFQFNPSNYIMYSDNPFSYASIDYLVSKIKYDLVYDDDNTYISTDGFYFDITLDTTYENINQNIPIKSKRYRNFYINYTLNIGGSDIDIYSTTDDIVVRGSNDLSFTVPDFIASSYSGENVSRLKIDLKFDNSKNIMRYCGDWYPENELASFSIDINRKVENDRADEYVPELIKESYSPGNNIPVLVADYDSDDLLVDIVELNRKFKTAHGNTVYDKWFYYKIPNLKSNIDYWPIELIYTPYPFSVSRLENKLKLEKELNLEIKYNHELFKLLTKITDSTENKIYKLTIGLRVHIPGIHDPNDPENSSMEVFVGDVAKIGFSKNKITITAKTMTIDYDKYITLTTSDFCPFAFKSVECGFTKLEDYYGQNPPLPDEEKKVLSVMCNKTQEDCLKHFGGNPEIAKCHFGGLFNISYYNKNPGITRG